MADDHTPGGAANRHHSDPSRGAFRAVPDNTTLNEDFLARLHAAALSSDQSRCDDAITYGLSNGIGAVAIAEQYIPAVARIMGEAWCSDEMSFASVTIGVSRLQGMLRDLGPDWADDRNVPANAATVVIAVAAECHHTLGAMVLAGKLRRMGISVRLLLGATPTLIKASLQQSRPDAIFLSAASGDSLDSIRRIVKSIRSVGGSASKVVIGGTILTTTPEVLALTGADFASNDPDEAIALCALNEQHLKTFQKSRGR